MPGIVISDLIARLGIDPRDFDKKLIGAEKKLRSAARKLDDIGRTLSINVSVPIAAVGGLAIKSFADFDAAMTKSTAIMGDVSDRLGEMEEAALDVARSTTFSAAQAGEAFFFLASAGLDAEASIAALPKVAAFAQAGMFDLATATDLLTDAQSALGLVTGDVAQDMENLTRVSDVLVKANTIANASVEQFSQSLTNQAAAAARNVGIELEEVTAVLAAFADQGIKGAEAGTKFAIVVRDLTTKAAKNAEAFDRFGISVFDAQGNLNPLADILEDLEGLLGNASVELQKLTLAQLGFSDKSVGALQSLLGLSDKVRDYEERLKKAGGTTQTVADKQLKSFSNQMLLLRNRVTEVLIKLGAELVPIIQSEVIPLIDSFIKSVKSLVEWFASLSSTTKKWIVGLTALVAAVGPAAIAISALVKVVLALKVLLLSPVFLSIAAGAGLVLGLTLLAKQFLVSADAAKAYAGEMVGASEAMQRAAKAGRTLEEQLKLEAIAQGQRNILAIRGQLIDLDKIQAKMAAEKDWAGFNATQQVVERMKMALADAGRELRMLQDPGAFQPGGDEFVGPVLPEDETTAGFRKLLDGFNELGKQATDVFTGIREVGSKAFTAVGETIDGVVTTTSEKFAEFFRSIDEQQIAFGEAANNAWATWLAQATDVTSQIKLATLDLFQSFASGLGNTVAQILVFKADAEEAFKALLANVLAQVISTLTRIVVEFLIVTATKAIIASVAHTLQVAQAIQLVYLATLASISAIPIVGPAAAPAAAAAAAAAAGPASAAAGKTGSGFALASLDTGGLAMQDGIARIHRGERVLRPEEVKVLPDLQVGATTVIIELDGRVIAAQTVRRMPGVLRMRGVGR